MNSFNFPIEGGMCCDDVSVEDTANLNFVCSDCTQVYSSLADFDNVTVEESLSVKGRLKQALPYWKTFCSDQFILETLEFGYKLPLLHVPPPTGRFYNNKSALDNSDFVTQAIEQLLTSGCVKPVSEKPHMVNPLSVSIQSSGKKRLDSRS